MASSFFEYLYINFCKMIYGAKVEAADNRIMEIKASHERIVQEAEEEFARRLRTITDKADTATKILSLQVRYIHSIHLSLPSQDT